MPPQSRDDGSHAQNVQRSGPDVSQFQQELSELRNLYGRMHNDFQGMLAQAQTALAERDGYIQHLVQQVQHWQSRYTGAAPDGQNDTVTTGVFHKLESPSHSSTGMGELEAEVARLKDEQRRLARELAEKNAFLKPSDEDNDTSERHSPTREELGIEDSHVVNVEELGFDSEAEDVADEPGEAESDGLDEASSSAASEEEEVSLEEESSEASASTNESEVEEDSDESEDAEESAEDQEDEEAGEDEPAEEEE